MLFELYLMDLLPEKREEFLEAHGYWDVDVENPSAFPNNWDIMPIMVFDTDDFDFDNLFESKSKLTENKTLTEGLINTNEFINGVNNSRKDYYEKIIRFFGGGGVIITLTSLVDLYVTDIDTNETVKFATLKTNPRNHNDWAWELRDRLLDLEIILSSGNYKKELGI